jgi:hemerythrin-like domain-containing protein
MAFHSPAGGFDQPLDLWLGCHQRVRRFNSLLVRLEAHVARKGADDEAQQAAASILRYFKEAAPRHHEDEEVDLFPLLRERAGDSEQAALDALSRIESEHLTMAQLWRRLDAVLARIGRGEDAVLDRALVICFNAMYDAHIDIEEHVVLPALRRALQPGDWMAVGRAMAERRGQTWKPAAAAGG